MAHEEAVPVPFRHRELDLTAKRQGPVTDPGTILSVLVAQLVDRLGGDGFWNGDYGWGVRVRRPFGARGMSSVRYGTRLGVLKNKQSTHTRPSYDADPPLSGLTMVARVMQTAKEPRADAGRF